MLFLVALLPLLALANAASHIPPHLRHRKIAVNQVQRDTSSGAQIGARANQGHSDAHQIIKRVVKKRGEQCRIRPPLTNTTSSASLSSSASTSVSDTAPTTSIDNQAAYAHGSQSSSTSTSSAAAQSSASSNNNSGSTGANYGRLNVNDNKCGWCGSSDDNPNGAEEWLNCGLNSGGWSPPNVKMSDLIAKAITDCDIFAPCAPYIDKFNTYANQYGIHPIMLASFAMQESTCNPWATGGNKEAGLMQIAQSNCNNPSGDCYDVDYNIRRGAELFSQMIQYNGGNVFAAIGAYNGWRVNMTIDDATRAKSQGNCLAQNNLDYIHQFTNGWMQCKNGYNIGTYFNLRGC